MKPKVEYVVQYQLAYAKRWWNWGVRRSFGAAIHLARQTINNNEQFYAVRVIKRTITEEVIK